MTAVAPRSESSVQASKRTEVLENRPVNLDGFVEEWPEKGLVAMESDFDHRLLRQALADTWHVHVALHGGDRRNGLQMAQHRQGYHVAGVQNHVNPLKGINNRLGKFARRQMGITDKANFHLSFLVCFLIPEPCIRRSWRPVRIENGIPTHRLGGGIPRNAAEIQVK